MIQESEASVMQEGTPLPQLKKKERLLYPRA
jgi:hypothetical protein